MKIALYIILTLIFLSWTFGVHVGFKPFKVEVKNVYYGIGAIFMMGAIVFFTLQGEKNGYKRGYQKAFDDATEIIEEETRKIKLRNAERNI